MSTGASLFVGALLILSAAGFWYRQSGGRELPGKEFRSRLRRIDPSLALSESANRFGYLVLSAVFAIIGFALIIDGIF